MRDLPKTKAIRELEMNELDMARHCKWAFYLLEMAGLFFVCWQNDPSLKTHQVLLILTYFDALFISKLKRIIHNTVTQIITEMLTLPT